MDFARISLLNTLLCVLAIIYGLPCRLYRKMATFLRTTYSLLFFLFFMMVIITPLSLALHQNRKDDRKETGSAP